MQAINSDKQNPFSFFHLLLFLSVLFLEFLAISLSVQFVCSRDLYNSLTMIIVSLLFVAAKALSGCYVVENLFI